MRSEQEIFQDLANLCCSTGYVHALSLICSRDNYIRFRREIKAEDMQHLFSRDRLIRTEITTLIGLLIKKPIDFSHPGLDALSDLIQRTESLLNELHNCLAAPMFARMFTESATAQSSSGPELTAAAMREPIFYGGESAYGFQYRDFAEKKYSADDQWLMKQMGFSIGEVKKVVSAVGIVQDRKVCAAYQALRSLPREEWTMLPGFIFTADEVANQANLPVGTVKCVLEAFVCADGANSGFVSLHDYNAVSGAPLLRAQPGEYLLLQQYSLCEALYESPFYWLCSDENYAPTALSNRGRFTETIALERLSEVFGSKHVFANVDVWRTKGEKLGEIDVLVIFSDRAIVLQAKSKKLTLEARKGNDQQLKDDFKKAIQSSYDQAHSCAVALASGNANLTDASGKPITLPYPVSRVYPVCIVADHYPALSFQAREFLRVQTTDQIAAPLVADVFALDAITEMLETPLWLLSYLELRARFGHRLFISHELTLLGFHLRRNLWISSEIDMVVLEDDLSADLDIAMAARREGLPGRRTPEGIITRIHSTKLGRIIADIENLPEPTTIDLGLLLLTVGEDTIKTLDKGIRQIIAATKRDGQKHDITVGFSTESTGLTIHCNPAPLYNARAAIEQHCRVRKYLEKANQWFGLVLNPDVALRLALKLEFPWTKDPKMEVMTQSWPRLTTRPASVIGTRKARKTGRNEPCPCGSGKKYKHCHLRN